MKHTFFPTMCASFEAAPSLTDFVKKKKNVRRDKSETLIVHYVCVIFAFLSARNF